jgi:fatty-acyl-CoA synthase
MSAFTDRMYANAETTARGLVTGATDAPVRRSWGEIHHQARRLAGALAQAGVGPGGAVAVLAGDPADVAALAQAVWMRGASLTMLQQPTPRTDLELWLADTHRAATMIGAALTIVGPPFQAAGAPLSAAGQNVLTVAELRTGTAIEPLHPDESTVAMHQLTSGSTGSPKAVQMTGSPVVGRTNSRRESPA